VKRSWTLQLFVVGAVLLPATLAWAGLKEKIDSEVQKIKEQTGVQVHYLYNPATFFPKEWLEDDIAATAEQLPLDEVWHMIPLVKQFLAAYPADVLRTNLTAIYLVTGLNIMGKNFGGDFFGVRHLH